MRLKNMIEAAAGFFAVRKCAVCGKVLSDEERGGGGAHRQAVLHSVSPILAFCVCIDVQERVCEADEPPTSVL